MAHRVSDRARFLTQVDRWVDHTLAVGSPDRDELARAAGVEVARRAGWVVPDLHTTPVPDLPDPPPGGDLSLPGEVWIRTRSGREARRRGAVATPPAVARRVVDLALHRFGGVPRVIWDPAVGGGVFLLAAADALVERGVEPGLVLRCLHGTDIDPVAATFAAAALRTWARNRAVEADPIIERGDGLTVGPGSVELVVGNPPFRGQLTRNSNRDRREREVADGLLGGAAGYADAASLFLVRSVDVLEPGGVTALVQPQSVLAARDSAGARRLVLSRAALEELWLIDAPVFAASVHTCVPVLRRGGTSRRTVLRRGVDAREVATVAAPTANEPWAGLGADARGVPRLGRARSHRTLGELTSVTADFREAFYEVAAAVEDAPEAGAPGMAPVLTSGLIDPADIGWGRRPARLGGRRWDRPAVDMARLGDWAMRRRAPKVVVATQTRVIEAAADPDGRFLPVTPVVTVEAADGECWRVLAALCDPWVSAWAARRAAGTGLSIDAVRVSAALLRDVPLAPGRAEWDEAAALLCDGHPATAAAPLMLAARGIHGSAARGLLTWWGERLPRRATSRRKGAPRPSR